MSMVDHCAVFIVPRWLSLMFRSNNLYDSEPVEVIKTHFNFNLIRSVLTQSVFVTSIEEDLIYTSAQFHPVHNRGA